MPSLYCCMGYSVPGAGLAFVFELHEISVAQFSSLFWDFWAAALPSSVLTASLPQLANHFIVEGNYVGQAEFASSKSILAIPNHLLALHVCGNYFRGNFLHNLPAKWLLVPHILLLDLLQLDIFTIFQLFGTFSCHHDRLQMLESGPIMTSAHSVRAFGHIWSHRLLHVHFA